MEKTSILLQKNLHTNTLEKKISRTFSEPHATGGKNIMHTHLNKKILVYERLLNILSLCQARGKQCNHYQEIEIFSLFYTEV